MIAMKLRGPLQCSYIVERNDEMQKGIIEMVRRDVTV